MESREERTDGRWCLMLGPRHNCLGQLQVFPTLGVGQTLFLLAGEGSGGLHLTTQSPTLPLCSSPFHPTPRCRRNIRNMSQRHKGPGGPRHQQHNSFLPLSHPSSPEPGLSFYLFPQTRDLPSAPRHRPRACVRVCPALPSVLPARVHP